MIVKICDLLSPFSKVEMKKLGRYLQYRSNSPDLQTLFAYLQEEHPSYKIRNKDKKEVAKKFFSNKKDSVKTLENTVGKLLTCILDFIVAQQCESNLTKSHSKQSHSKEYNFVLLKEYQNRRLDDAFFKLVKKLEKKWNLILKEDVGIEHMQCITRLWTMKINHPASRPREAVKSFKNIFVTLDQYYFASKLYWTLVKSNNERVVGLSEIEDFQTYPENRIIEYISINSENFGPQNSLLAKISGVYYKNDVKEIQNLKTEVLEKLTYFNDAEKKCLFQFLVDIHKNNFRAGMLESADTLFELYKYGLKDGLLCNGSFASDVFLSIIHVTSTINQIEWAKQFIIDYNDQIIEKDRKDAVHLGNATIALSEWDGTKVLEELMFVDDTNLVFNVRSRVLKLLAFFQLKESGPLIDGINAFNAYINNKLKNGVISEGIHEEIKAFLFFLRKIDNSRNKTKKNDCEKIKQEIEKCTKISCKIWLLEIINKLISDESK